MAAKEEFMQSKQVKELMELMALLAKLTPTQAAKVEGVAIGLLLAQSGKPA